MDIRGHIAMAPRFSCLTWFNAVEFEHFRALFPVRYPNSYETWRASAEQVVEVNRASGIETETVEVHAEGFVAWCRALGRDIDGRALLDYTDRLGVARRCRRSGN